MNRKNRAFSSCPGIVVILLLCLLLSACQKEPDLAGEPSADPTETTGTDATVEANSHFLSGADAYRIVYDKDCGTRVKEACKLLQEKLGGIEMVSDEDAEETEYEILIGDTDRSGSAAGAEDLEEADYRVSVAGKKLVFSGGGDTALINAIADFVRDDAVKESDECGWTVPAAYSLYFDGAESREEYIADPDRFLVNWAYKFDVPDWLLDYEEKKAAFRDPGGRIMATHHRAGFYYYPENSIEAIISSVKMGADCIEIDLRITQDGVVVLLHNDTLSATTDWSSKQGKDGLPSSDAVSDWTYEQLCQLRLLTYDGKVTDYQIPTFEEALLVCKGRSFLRLDKIGRAYWDSHIYPLIQKTEAWSTCIIPDWYPLEQKKAIADTIKEESGEDIMFYVSLYPDQCDQWEAEVDALLEGGYLPIMRWETFRTAGKEDRVSAVSPYLEQIKDKVRINTDVQAANQCTEKAEVWDYLHEVGVGLMLIDNVLMIQQYIAENYSPTSY